MIVFDERRAINRLAVAVAGVRGLLNQDTEHLESLLERALHAGDLGIAAKAVEAADRGDHVADAALRTVAAELQSRMLQGRHPRSSGGGFPQRLGDAEVAKVKNPAPVVPVFIALWDLSILAQRISEAPARRMYMTASRKPFAHWILHVGLMLLLALATGRVMAEPVFSFSATPGKLPKAVVPIHYALDITPDLDTLTFSGSESVDIEVRAPTERLVLNAVDMTIGAAAIEGEAAPQITSDPAAQTVTFAFPYPIAAGRHQLRISFTGQINRFGRGLFVVDYPTAEGRKRMISSHLEPVDARRIFPSWDEPAFKASIALTVTVPQAFLAVCSRKSTADNGESVCVVASRWGHRKAERRGGLAVHDHARRTGL
jgi:hypothetical protein